MQHWLCAKEGRGVPVERRCNSSRSVLAWRCVLVSIFSCLIPILSVFFPVFFQFFQYFFLSSSNSFSIFSCLLPILSVTFPVFFQFFQYLFLSSSSSFSIFSCLLPVLSRERRCSWIRNALAWRCVLVSIFFISWSNGRLGCCIMKVNKTIISDKMMIEMISVSFPVGKSLHLLSRVESGVFRHNGVLIKRSP